MIPNIVQYTEDFVHISLRYVVARTVYKISNLYMPHAPDYTWAVGVHNVNTDDKIITIEVHNDALLSMRDYLRGDIYLFNYGFHDNSIIPTAYLRIEE